MEYGPQIKISKQLHKIKENKGGEQMSNKIYMSSEINDFTGRDEMVLTQIMDGEKDTFTDNPNYQEVVFPIHSKPIKEAK